MSMDVLLVEDDNLIRITLAASLRSAGIENIYSAPSVTEALKLADTHIPNVALLDLHLGGGPTGLDLARQLRLRNSRIGIVILTSYDDPRLLGENPDFVPSGTTYLRKEDVSDISVLTRALAAAPTSNRLLPKSQPAGLNLTQTQLEILKLIAEGYSNTEIARRRGVTEKAVEATINRLATKLALEKDSATNQRVHIARVYFRALGLKIDDAETTT